MFRGGEDEGEADGISVGFHFVGWVSWRGAFVDDGGGVFQHDLKLVTTEDQVVAEDCDHLHRLLRGEHDSQAPKVEGVFSNLQIAGPSLPAGGMDAVVGIESGHSFGLSGNKGKREDGVVVSMSNKHWI